MADDQVKYSDLFDAGIIGAVEELTGKIKDLSSAISEAKKEANGLRDNLRGASTATRDQQQATSSDAAAVDALNKKVKQLTDEQLRLQNTLNAVNRMTKKLTSDERDRLLNLGRSMNRLVTEVRAGENANKKAMQSVMAKVNAIETEKVSYNELSATYAAMKAALNQMTKEERLNTQAGKLLTDQSRKIMETMNELQISTGKYTMQVGKYRAAFDGLGYSIQQVVREVPSALNINQFMLAISNNIPMVIDQLKAFKNEQDEIKENLSKMTKGTAEYEEQQAKLMSTGTKLWKSIWNWQTAVIAVLLLLRNINLDKIWGWFTKLIGKAKEYVVNLVSIRRAFDEITTSVEKSVAATEQELDVLVDKLSEVARGTKEWKDIIDRVNELTQSNLDSTTATVAKVKAVTDAYLEQQRVLAVNAAVIDKLAEFQVNKSIRDRIMGNAQMSPQGAASLLGMKEGDDGYDEFIESFNEYLQTRRNYEEYKRLGGEYVTMNTPVVGGLAGRGTSTRRFVPADEESDRRAKEELNSVTKAVESVIASKLNLPAGGVEEFLKSLYNSAGAINPVTPKNEKEPKDQVADLLTLTREWEDAVIANIEDEFKREEEAEIKRHERFLIDKKAELKLVEGDAERTAIINKQIEEETNTHDNNMLNIDEKYRQVIIKRIEDQKKKEEQVQKEAERQAKEKIQREEKDFKAHQEIDKRRFELTKHTATEEKKFVMEQQMEFLQWRIDHAEALGISPELLEVMKAEYEQMKKMYDLGKYSNGKQNIQGNYTSISQILWPDLDSDQTSALNSVFDQAKEALNGWMQAKVDAANQSKELADDEVAAAENALNREIELRNQGYANDVALRERELADAKKRQQQAAKLQQKAKKDQLAVNTAMEASSMAVAVANLFKDFPLYAAIPLTAVLLGAFAAAKVQSFQAINSTQYREGGVMLLEGGSHQSGHDVNLGIGPDGSNLRAEGGEYFAVINKRNSRRYGSEIPNIVNALNSGMFEDRYIKTSDAMGMLPRVIKADDGSAVDLSAVESGVGALVKQGERTSWVEGNYRYERYKNLTRKIRVS